MAGPSSGDIFDQVPATASAVQPRQPRQPKTDIFDRVATPAQMEAHGASGSWDPIRPTFFRGLGESAGVPSWESTKKFLTSAYHHPVDTAEDTAKTAAAVAKYAATNTGDFIWAMTNIPQIKKAYQEGNYAETAGLLVGTLGQTALTFFTGEGVIPQSVRAFKAGWIGKTAEEFAASERALKATRAAERTDRLSKLANSVKLTITPGERLKGGKLEAAETALRGFPGISGPFQKIASQRRDAILALHDSLSGEAEALRGSAQSLYDAIGNRVPRFTELQDQVKQLRKDMYKTKDPQVRYNIGLNLEQVEKQAFEAVSKAGDPVAVASWQHADSLWRRYRAKQDLQQTIEGNIVGRSAEKLASTGKTEEAARPAQVKSLTQDLEDLQRDGTLKAALGDQRASQLIRVASLYDRVRKSGSGYMAERLLGYGIIGALPFLPKGYVFDIAAGAVGGMVLSWGLLKGGSTTATLEGFLRASEAGDIVKSRQYAAMLTRAAEQASQAAAARPKPSPTPMPPMSEAAKLRMNVPLNLQPAAGEDPLRDMLTSLFNQLTAEGKTAESGAQAESKLRSQMESAAEKKRTSYRTADEMDRINQLLKQAGGAP